MQLHIADVPRTRSYRLRKHGLKSLEPADVAVGSMPPNWANVIHHGTYELLVQRQSVPDGDCCAYPEAGMISTDVVLPFSLLCSHKTYKKVSICSSVKMYTAACGDLFPVHVFTSALFVLKVGINVDAMLALNLGDSPHVRSCFMLQDVHGRERTFEKCPYHLPSSGCLLNSSASSQTKTETEQVATKIQQK